MHIINGGLNIFYLSFQMTFTKHFGELNIVQNYYIITKKIHWIGLLFNCFSKAFADAKWTDKRVGGNR